MGSVILRERTGDDLSKSDRVRWCRKVDEPGHVAGARCDCENGLEIPSRVMRVYNLKGTVCPGSVCDE
jgi:hypothetical protein